MQHLYMMHLIPGDVRQTDRWSFLMRDTTEFNVSKSVHWHQNNNVLMSFSVSKQSIRSPSRVDPNTLYVMSLNLVTRQKRPCTPGKIDNPQKMGQARNVLPSIRYIFPQHFPSSPRKKIDSISAQ